ncbi:MAG: hypothetical protein IRY91_01310 [Gemmatimonadaceae bacterium]|nr:hypothetical protein [Gemmatimonadaceae bacterium]
MSTSTMSVAGEERGIAARFLMAGAVVAALDGLFAVGLCMSVNQTCTPARVFQSIAAGLLGRPAAYDGGMATALLGVALHLTVAFGWTTVYLLAVRYVPWLARAVRTRLGRLEVALVFGAIIWLVMDLVVIPLSQARQTPVSSPFFWVVLAEHPVLVAFPMVALLGDGRAGRRAAA